MESMVTQAIVVAKNPVRERDVFVSLFTPDFGIIEARASGARNITAKLSPHLDPVRRSRVRITKKHGFVVTDALTEDSWEDIKSNVDCFSRLIRSCALIESVAPRGEGNGATWHELNRKFSDGTVTPKMVLGMFGYGSNLVCSSCGRVADLWHIEDHAPICRLCAGEISERGIVVL